MVPWSQRRLGTPFLNRVAKLADPDPFLVRSSGDKWLTDELINKFMTVIAEDNHENGLPTICNMGPFGYSTMVGTYAVDSPNKIKSYVEATFRERPFTRRRLLYLTYTFRLIKRFSY